MVDTENRGCPCRRGSRGQRGPLGFSSLGVGHTAAHWSSQSPLHTTPCPVLPLLLPFTLCSISFHLMKQRGFILYCWKWGVVKIFHGSYQGCLLMAQMLYLDYSLKASVETFLSRQYRSLWMPLNSYRIQWIQRKDKTSSTVNKNDSMYWFRHKGYILDTSVIQRETYSSSFNISKDIFWEIGWNMRCQAMRLWL